LAAGDDPLSPPGKVKPVRARTLVLGTRNPGKLREITQVLGDLPVRVVGLDEFPAMPEPVEDGATFAENARNKALHYARATRHWCLADDSGLEVDALNGAPGVRSARYAADHCPTGADRLTIDQANNAKLLSALEGVGDERRTARFVCHLALADPEHVFIETFDTVEGRIGYEPRGSNGFGYDPLFFIPEAGCTTAELPEEEKNRISHRGKAVRHFAGLLKTFLRQEQHEQGS
jgi:XTP/dITP diphosphohydrolase